MPPQGATTVWDALTEAGAAPIGLGARDTLRLEVCFHLYGNDLSEDRNPIEAGLGWCCKEDTGFIGADAIAAARENGTAEQLVPFALTGPGIARQGNPITGGGEVTSGTLSPCLEHRHRHGLPAGGQDRARHPVRDRRSRQAPDRRGPREAPLPQGVDLGRGLVPVGPQVPRRARLGADRRRHRDDGHHLVRAGAAGRGRVLRPAGGRRDGQARTSRTPRSSPSRRSPTWSRRCRGEITEVNEALGDAPEQINEDPYGEGWMVKIRLSNVSEVGRPDGRVRLRGHPDLDEPLHLRHRRRPPRDARRHRRRVDRRAVRRRAGGGPPRPPARPPARQAGAGGLRAACATSPPATSRPRTRSASSAPGCTTTTSRA